MCLPIHLALTVEAVVDLGFIDRVLGRKQWVAGK